MGTYTTTVQKGSRWARLFKVGTEITIHRTHIRAIHPTKGYREFSVPAGTNRRRRIIRTLVNQIVGSKAWNRRLLSLAGGVSLRKAVRAYIRYVLKSAPEKPIPA